MIVTFGGGLLLNTDGLLARRTAHLRRLHGRDTRAICATCGDFLALLPIWKQRRCVRARGARQGPRPTAPSCPPGRSPVPAPASSHRRSPTRPPAAPASPPIATSSSVAPRSLANASSRSTRSSFAVLELAAVQPRSLRRRLAAPVLAGEQAAREREVRDEADAEPLAGRQQLVLRAAREPRVLVLLRGERRQLALAGDA